MATISRSEKRTDKRLRDLLYSSQLRYAATYILISSVVLLVLNIYAPITIRNLTFSAQRSAIIDKAQLLVATFSSFDRLTEENVGETIQSANDLHTARVVITDSGARCLYDSLDQDGSRGRFILYPEVAEALEGNDAVYLRYEQDQIVSKAAMPIVAYNKIIGAVYLLERDEDQAALISSLQRNILWISVGLEIAIVLFSIFFSVLFSRRMADVFASVRRLHDGDYSVRLPEGRFDEMGRLGVAFNELAERLRHSEEVRKQFVSNASHELKTPLASIKLLSDSILQNDMDDSTMREFVGDIGNEADRLTRLSAKLLELTRLDTQPVEEREAVSVLPVADRVLRMLNPVARKQGVRLELDCPARCAILGTPDDLYQILFNLVENGIKYNVSGGTVRLGARDEGEQLRIVVEDSGVGIPDSEKAHVFERFYRVDKARSRKAGGAGLGLSIVYDMVLRNGGTIHIEDRPGGGTRFCLRFPACPAQKEEL